MRARHARAFGTEPASFARAPGRVNLIGEHVDYCGLSVLPVAIRREVKIAFTSRGDDRSRFVNVDDARFPPREFDGRDESAPPRGDWITYVRAVAREMDASHGARRGIDACVHGDVPLAAGLSSSSALVVATALAYVAANELVVAREELMELCARAERRIGLESGGMDQAVSLGARAGRALRVDFGPLRTRSIAIPPTWRFVVANSGVGAEKAGRARDAYNARVTECREALRLVLAHPMAREWPRTWRGLVESVAKGELLEAGARALDGDVARRWRHVIGEAFRVERAVVALERGDAAAFGRSMDASHASLRDDHDVSCAELDACVRVAREAGAIGARLTGAGFGGCIVALADEATAPAIVSALRRHAGPDSSADAVFLAESGDGASVTRA